MRNGVRDLITYNIAILRTFTPEPWNFTLSIGTSIQAIPWSMTNWNVQSLLQDSVETPVQRIKEGRKEARAPLFPKDTRFTFLGEEELVKFVLDAIGIRGTDCR